MIFQRGGGGGGGGVGGTTKASERAVIVPYKESLAINHLKTTFYCHNIFDLLNQKSLHYVS